MSTATIAKYNLEQTPKQDLDRAQYTQKKASCIKSALDLTLASIQDINLAIEATELSAKETALATSIVDLNKSVADLTSCFTQYTQRTLLDDNIIKAMKAIEDIYESAQYQATSIQANLYQNATNAVEPLNMEHVLKLYNNHTYFNNIADLAVQGANYTYGKATCINEALDLGYQAIWHINHAINEPVISIQTGDLALSHIYNQQSMEKAISCQQQYSKPTWLDRSFATALHNFNQDFSEATKQAAIINAKLEEMYHETQNIAGDTPTTIHQDY